jgi:hypothetical protein
MAHTHWAPNTYTEKVENETFVSIVGHEFTYLGQTAENIVAAYGGWPGEFDMAYEYPVFFPHTN